MTNNETRVFIVVEEMEPDYGGGAYTQGAFSSVEKAEAKIAELERERDSGQRSYKYRTTWFCVEAVLDGDVCI